MEVMLDTCAWLWLAMEPECLSGDAERILNDSNNTVFVSEISTLEIVLKYRAGKLPLSTHPRDWVPKSHDFYNLVALPFDSEVIFHSGELPDVHTDPFDRLIAAHAITSRLTILSPDKQLSLLGASRIW